MVIWPMKMLTTNAAGERIWTEAIHSVDYQDSVKVWACHHAHEISQRKTDTP